MNQTPSGWLRTRYLLLLAPLLMASTPSPLTVTNRLVLAQVANGESLAFLNLPRELLLFSCTPIKVGVVDSRGQTVVPGVDVQVTLSGSLLGAFHATSACDDAIDSVLIPSDVSEVGVWYKPTLLGGLTLKASAGSASGLLDGTAGPIPVVDSLTERLELTVPTSSVAANTPFDITVTASNLLGRAQAYSGTIHFSSNPPIPGLPPDYTFDPIVDAGDRVFTIMLPPGGPYSITVQDINDGRLQDRESIAVQAVPGTPKVAAYARAAQAATCEPVTIDLTVVDDAGNPAPTTSATVSLCRSSNSQAQPSDTNMADATLGTPCVTGTVNGSAYVTWRSTHWEDTTFTISLANSGAPAQVSWRPRISPENSSFIFVSSDDPIPLLAVDTQTATLQLNLSDTCPQPLVLPPDKTLTFGAEEPLTVEAPKEQLGQWSTTVRLHQCPEDPTRPLAIWPMINEQPILKPDGRKFERFVQPQCPPSVELSVFSLMEDKGVEPGGQVLFEVEIANKGKVAVQNGVLVLTVEGLTVVDAITDGVSLTQQQGGFMLPELRPDSKLRVKIKAVATTQLDQPMTAKVRLMASDGTPLTEEEPISFVRDDLGVNVGCGCHSAGLPSQLLPWLALLLAASRPWARLRRLTRAERTDRQSPW